MAFHTWMRFFFLYIFPETHWWCSFQNLEVSYLSCSAWDTVRLHVEYCQFLVQFHRYINVLNIAQQHSSQICCTHFTAIIHNMFRLCNQLFCFPVTLSSIHIFIWMKDGKHSYIPSVTLLHGHKWITGRYLYITWWKLWWRKLAYVPICCPAVCHRNWSSVCE
jgi:hypothetical protein